MATQIARLEEVGVRPSVVLGRVVQSQEYGRGYIAEIQDDAIRVRFWRHGYKTFRGADHEYPFQLLDEVRPLKVLAGKLPYYCEHHQIRCLCWRCAGLSEDEINHWNKHRTTERSIVGKSRGDRYTSVTISTNDCVLVYRNTEPVPANEISDWYQCHWCERTHERSHNEELTKCPDCGGAVNAVAEPFQTTQFSPHFGNGAERGAYADAEPVQRAAASEEAIILADLYADPNSRFQAGGTGFLRIPLDAPRINRADAPEWLDRRQEFFKTLRGRRADRAEQFFSEFYLDGKTDKQIGDSVGWTKHAVKKERAVLLRRGNHFFCNLVAADAAPP